MTSLKLIGVSAVLALTLSAPAGFAKQPVATPVATHTPGAMARAALAARAAMQRKMAAAHTPAPKSPTAPAAPASAAKAGNLGPGEHSAISIACSQKADAQGLHGQARQAFRSKCKHGG